MIITPDSPKQIADRMRTTIKNELPESNPFLENSYLNADVVAYAGALFQVYQQLKVVLNELFPDTASVESLERWGAIYGVTRRPASQASGNVTVNGVPASVIPPDTLLVNQNGANYNTLNDESIGVTPIATTSFEFNPSTITFTTGLPHPLATGIDITVSGFNEAEANGTFTVFVTDEFTFSYEVPDLVIAPTGTPVVEANIAVLEVKSEDFGDDTNLKSGNPLSFGITLAGVNQEAFVQPSTISGGADIEDTESLRERLLFRIRNPYPFFSVSFIIQTVKEFPGVTRVFVQEGVGTVTILFTLDNNENNIPSGQTVADVKEKLETVRFIGLPSERMIVTAPTPTIVDVVFQFITPDIPSMRTAVEENIRDFFRTRTTLGENIKNRDFQCAIEETIDLVTGDPLSDFNLVSPAGDIVLNNNEIAVLGTVSYEV